MALFDVPDEAKDAFAELAGLTDEQYTALLGALRDAPELLFPRRRIERLLAERGQSPSDESMEVVDQLLRLLVTRSDFRSGDSTPDDAEIVDNVVSQVGSGGNEALTPSAAAKLRARLAEIFELSALRVSAKATQLRLEEDKRFSDAICLTDVRPVFDETGDRVVATFMLHRLKLLYFTNDSDDGRSITLTLDEEEVEDLIRTLQRAKLKAATIRKRGFDEVPLLDIGKYD
jgi:hypothetical protein